MLPRTQGAGGSESRAANGTNGSRKLVIKPFKVQPKAPENFWAESWEKLRSAVGAVYAKNASEISKEELYRTVEDVCKQRMAEQLYVALAGQLKEFITAKVTYLQEHQSPDADTFLDLVQSVWNDHSYQLSTIRNIFLYLDRNYALQTSGVQVLWDLGHSIFRSRLDEIPQLQTLIIQSLLAAIDRLRQGAITNSQQIGQLAQMLLTLRLYHTVFQQAFLQDAARFYSQEGKHYIEQLDTSRFLLLVDKRLNESIELTTKYLDASTRKPLLEVVEAYLLAPHVLQLIERGAQPLLEAHAITDLKRMYLLFDRVQSVDKLKVAWTQYIKLVGERIVSPGTTTGSGSSGSGGTGGGGAEGKGEAKDQAAHREVVEEVIALQERLTALLKDAFFNNEAFRLALKNAFDYFLNLNMRNTAEQVAKYVDRKMRGEKGVTEAEAEAKLESVMTVFKHLQEKDIFEAFYKKHLARRLLQGKSASDELEKAMLSKLKAECGANFTSKLEGMFHDIELSKQCQTAYAQACAANSTTESPTMHLVGPAESSLYVPEPELHIQVLTSGYWPTPPASDKIVLPSELQALVNQFSAFYHNKYQGRRLVWAHSLARCLVTFRLPSGSKKELEVSLFQALVLRCYSSADRWSLEEIHARTGIEMEELKRTLLSLCHIPGCSSVLIKEPKSKDVKAGDVFQVNMEFTSRQFRIKVGTLAVKESSEEVQRTHEEVFRDREYQADAVIVRIMKSRKRLNHSTLISEVMAQLRFPAQSSDLKKRIEALIERDFLERDPDDPSVYNYLA